MVGRLENKVAIITGGAGGIGAATGLLFCQEGGRVVLVDNDSGAMRVAVSHIQNTVPGARVEAVVADVGKEETRRKGIIFCSRHRPRRLTSCGSLPSELELALAPQARNWPLPKIGLC